MLLRTTSLQRHSEPENSSEALGEMCCWILLFFSGGLALVYEILWMRRFSALFGATAPATAATLASVFLGFTLGSIVLGKLAARFARPLLAYGFAEISAGLGALLVGPILGWYDLLYPGLYRALGSSPVAFTVVKTLLAMASLLLPTFFMGGTVPLLCGALVNSRRGLGIAGEGLYAANTIGATFGALTVPWFWLPLLGVQTSYYICVISSLLLGALACLLGRKVFSASADSMAADENLPRPEKRWANPLPFWATLLFSSISGVIMFILQVTWGRMFAQVHENSIYSFSVVLAVFLAGLGIAATLVRMLLRRGWSARIIFGFAWICGGLAVFASAYLFYWQTGGLAYLKSNAGWTSYALKLFWLAVPSVLTPTLLAGMAFPALMELAGRGTHNTAGTVLGWLLGINTLGAVVGALLAAFWLPQWLGLWRTLAYAGLTMTIAGDVSLTEFHRFKLRRVVVIILVVCAILLWNPNTLPRTRIQQSNGEKLISLQEGSHGIVAVVDRPGSRRMKLENYYILGGTASTGDERMQTHIPLLLHPTPQRVAFLGLGTGIPAGAALLHPVEQITAVELVPEVIIAARDFFQRENLGVLKSPRAEILMEDARNFLLGSGRKFDVIIGDLVVPWRRGEAALYSSEHFRAGRSALRQRGIFCQWLPLFQLSKEEFSIIAATFVDVFPRTTVWRGDFAPDQPTIALIGQTDDAPLEPGIVERRVRELKPDSANPHLANAAGLWLFQAGFLRREDAEIAGAKRNNENRPWIELLGPLSHAGSSGSGRLFVGRRLESWLNQIRKRPLRGSPLADLQAAQLQWQEAGARIREATQLVLDGKTVEADNQIKQAVADLPTEVQKAFEP